MSSSTQTTTSDIDKDLEKRLRAIGFSGDQIDNMKVAGVRKALITPFIDADLNDEKIVKILTVLIALAMRLPASARITIAPQEYDRSILPTIATYSRDLSEHDAKLVGDIYQELADNTKIPGALYVIDRSGGWERLRSIDALEGEPDF
jgi:hypothetical protein